MAIQLLPDWSTQERSEEKDGATFRRGILMNGDVVGDYVVGPDGTLVTLTTMKADWLVRVVYPAPLETVLDAAVAAAEKVGAVKR